MKEKPKKFVYGAIEWCKRISHKKVSNRKIAKFGGYDNVTILLIIPRELKKTQFKRYQ